MTKPKCECGDLRNCKTCYMRDWRRRNPDKVKASKAKWAKTRDRAGDPKTLAYSAEYRATHPIKNEQDSRKRKARNDLASAVRYGRIQKEPCAVCGAEKVQAHHDDYDKPLEVIWLCTKHHADVHREA